MTSMETNQDDEQQLIYDDHDDEEDQLHEPQKHVIMEDKIIKIKKPDLKGRLEKDDGSAVHYDSATDEDEGVDVDSELDHEGYETFYHGPVEIPPYKMTDLKIHVHVTVLDKFGVNNFKLVYFATIEQIERYQKLFDQVDRSVDQLTELGHSHAIRCGMPIVALRGNVYQRAIVSCVMRGKNRVKFPDFGDEKSITSPVFPLHTDFSFAKVEPRAFPAYIHQSEYHLLNVDEKFTIRISDARGLSDGIEKDEIPIAHMI